MTAGEERTLFAHAPGLTSTDAAARLAADGPNIVPAPQDIAGWRRLVAQFTHFFAVLLWVAAGLAAVGNMPQLALAIVVVVLVNGVFAFAQERSASQAAARLRSMLPRRARVLRDGEICDIDAADLVVGDVVLLDAGDGISADLRIDASNGLAIDASMLTGESVPMWVGRGDDVAAGTFVVEGEATALVTATGVRTRLAGIVGLTQSSTRRTSPLTLELNRVVRVVAAVAVSVGVGFFAIGWLVGIGARDGFLFAVGVTVALVPEGLLPTVTLSLARGAQRMAEHNALVRHLESVETLGSTTFICTDKTGTLTRNEMTVVAAWTPQGSAEIRGAGYEPAGTVTCAPDV
ncbi:MAG TPA: HAD-IC family P-type ATPase, partial [Acidimicrobiales bacterium]|nr:HAD-IC family P-type ATPase [Acidimicrobiales bacterium]